MNSGYRNNSQGSDRRPGYGAVLAAVLPLLVVFGGFSSPAQAQRARPAAHPPAVRQAPPAPRPQQNRPANKQNNPYNNRQPANQPYRPGQNPQPNRPPQNAQPYRPQPGYPMRPAMNGPRPGLPGFVARNQNLTPEQQEQKLRSEPGFNRLSPEQQQRVINRLHTFDARPPQERERTAGRLEMFQRLSPSEQADVRTSTARFAAMPPDRKAMVRSAFNDLRSLPAGQRQQILNSSRFAQQFTPDERHVLGSMLSIEPYQQ